MRHRTMAVDARNKAQEQNANASLMSAAPMMLRLLRMVAKDGHMTELHLKDLKDLIKQIERGAYE